ncbi:hypothetical protein [Candidatus Villigracilis saccharophilus]|uniref:hypothetical protein n=1 Tax=Candidatus Villigracilis saccharophilus TaxID=3140684 RepID=UPI0031EC9456
MERSRTQGFSDLMVGSASAVGSLSSGFIFAALGYNTMAFVSAAFAVIPLIFASIWTKLGGEKKKHSLKNRGGTIVALFNQPLYFPSFLLVSSREAFLWMWFSFDRFSFLPCRLSSSLKYRPKRFMIGQVKPEP